MQKKKECCTGDNEDWENEVAKQIAQVKEELANQKLAVERHKDLQWKVNV